METIRLHLLGGNRSSPDMSGGLKWVDVYPISSTLTTRPAITIAA
jgi:hypothetical protein